MDELSALTGKPSDEAKSSTTFFRAPLLRILFPQIAAYVLCECGFSFSPKAGTVAAGIALILGLFSCVLAWFPENNRTNLKNDLWTICFPLAVFFLAGAWWSFRAPKDINWRGKPETELVLGIKIETPFRSAGKSWSGLARVESAPEYACELCGARIFYRFRKSETDATPHEGMRLQIRGVAQDLSADDWLAPEFRDFLISKKANILLGNGDSIRILDTGIATSITAWFAKQKNTLIQILIDPKNPREREQRILTAMLLGETALLPQEQREDFMLTGTMHIFAVSGLHVSLFAALLFGIFSRTGFPYWSIAVITIGVSCFYVLLTGAAPSAVRAWIMIVFLLSARLLGRSSNPLNALVLAASFALWQNPSLLSALGFQLSYGVVASIFLYGIPLANDWTSRSPIFGYIPYASRTPLQHFLVRLRETGIGLFSISLGTFVAGAAFIAGSFEIFTPVAVLANLILVPCVGLLLGTAVASAVLFYLPGGPPLATLLWEADCMLMFAVEVFAGTAAEISDGFETQFRFPWMSTLGGSLVLCVFSAGAFFEPLRSRPLLRFAFPPVFLCAYLLAFTC